MIIAHFRVCTVKESPFCLGKGEPGKLAMFRGEIVLLYCRIYFLVITEMLIFLVYI